MALTHIAVNFLCPFFLVLVIPQILAAVSGKSEVGCNQMNILTATYVLYEDYAPADSDSYLISQFGISICFYFIEVPKMIKLLVDFPSHVGNTFEASM